MEVIISLLLMAVILAAREKPTTPKALRTRFDDYNSFKNIIIKSPGSNTTYTEIDEAIVSPYGIFCIEYKGNAGYIFGSKYNAIWTQCKYDGRVPRPNPLRQNYKHKKALENLFGEQLKTHTRTYVVYTNAKIVNVDSSEVLKSTKELKSRISTFNRIIYTDSEIDYFYNLLARAELRSESLHNIHIEEVKALNTRVAPQSSI